MDLDGQAIERRDFPIARRGYEPAAVDAHLRELAGAVSALRSELRKGETIGHSAGSQVQGILDAAQSAAADIRSDAKAQAGEELAAAQREAARVRKDALSKASGHVAAVGEAAAMLSKRLEEMESRLEALTGGLLTGSKELEADLGRLRGELAALYDAAGGAARGDAPPVQGTGDGNGRGAVAQASLAYVQLEEDEAAAPTGPASADDEEEPPISDPEAELEEEPARAIGSGGGNRSSDVDGARLIALNMALNGDSREQTDRYLAEHFDLAEREKLVEEVFGAIEG
jgi:hypothetical protein